MRFPSLSLLLLLLLLGPSEGAASSSFSSSSTSDASVEGDDTAATSSTIVTGGVYPLVKDLQDGAAELRSFRTSKAANFCNRAPVVVVRAPTTNAGCPERWTGLSCSCVQSLQNDTTWALRVSKRSSSASPQAETVPATTAADAVSVSSLGTFLVSGNLVSLTLAGDSETPLDLELRLGVATNITDANIPTVLQNCNIASLSADFLGSRHDKLQRLYFQGNPITDWSVTLEQFEQLSKLSVLQTDAFGASAAPCNGTWQSISGTVRLCVVTPSSSKIAPIKNTTISDLLFVAVTIPSGFVVVLIAIALRRRCASRHAGKTDSFDISVLERTEDAHKPSIDDALLRDPVIVMNRIPFKHVVIAECLKQGGFGVMRPEFSSECPRAILELANQCLQLDPLQRPPSSHLYNIPVI
ncbi:hypothetical protein PybrP1_002940 [[Pythium] brassicae (nom. inval.)]|nr:hypothetical protein PybrP1_002940 [[Pythium] brassicae (nom. inval.)]